jgi:glycosyltransferase XagB
MKNNATKKMVSIVVPVYNELKNIKKLHNELRSEMSKVAIPYEIIYIDDNSTDGTYDYLNKVSKASEDTSHTFVFKKQGLRGKAYSLIEGFSYAKGTILCMIDGDMQYPPCAIPEMIKRLDEADIVVANRKDFQASAVRKVLSRGFRFIFGNVLFKLPTDIQSGLKVFKRSVYETVKSTPRSPWTFDLEFLYKARESGFVIENYDISFAPRENGFSNVNSVRQSVEIGYNALSLRAQKVRPLLIPPTSKKNDAGAGIGYKKRQYITHTTLPHTKTAMQTFITKQILFIILLLELLIYGLYTAPLFTIRMVIGMLSVIYFSDVIFNLYIIMRSLLHSQEISPSSTELASLKNAQLPMYTILCPLYKESNVLPQFSHAIEQLDWPKNKLDVMLLLEEDDTDTIHAANSMNLPPYFRIVVVPDSQPKTKPKACNYGLQFAKGEYIVIYDAEDMPDPLQLKKAYYGFTHSPTNIACLQAKLNYYNPHQNWLTRFFTAEYSLWFDLTLTGFQSINTSIPLGGTSNHFKTSVLRSLQGWDTFNVTEDADLGIRLFKEGYKTAIIDSVTLEEANSNPRNWIRQRSRWIKGYMQSYLVHTRDMFSLGKSIEYRVSSIKYEKTEKRKILNTQYSILNTITQIRDFISLNFIIGAKLTFIFLNPILWITTIAYFTLFKYVGTSIEQAYITPVFYLASLSLVFGNFLFFYYYMVGIAKRNQWDIMRHILLIPIYWIMISIAGWVAFYQLLLKPHYWEKTIHGLHLQKDETDEITEDEPTVDPANAPFIPKPIISPAFYTTAVIGGKGGVTHAQIEQPGYIKQIYYKFYAIYTSLELNISTLLNLFTKRNTPNQNTQKPTILIFNWRDSKHDWAGGAEVYIQEIAKRWVAQGNTVTLFCGNDGSSLQNEKVNGVHVIRRGGQYTVYVWAILYYLFRFRGKYDVVIDCENGIPFFTPLFVRKPIFLLIHHVHQEVFREYLIPPVATFVKLLESKLMPFVYRNRPVITVSESSKREIIKLGFSRPDNIEIIYNGINPDIFVPGKKTTAPSFIYLGRLKQHKNIDVCIKAFAKVLKKHTDATLHIVGSGECDVMLLELAISLGVEKNVEFHGRVNEKKKAKLLAQSWSMIQPSSIEGWGITVIEANSCKTPVIASKVNGLKDSVVHKQTGILVQPHNDEALAKVMNQLIKNEQLRQTLSENAFLWSHNFTWEKSADSFYSLIENTLTGKEFIPSYSKLILVSSKQA